MWQAKDEYLRYILRLLEDSIHPTSSVSNPASITKSIEEFSLIEDSCYYYAFIFTHDHGEGASESARGLAGLLLKNRLLKGTAENRSFELLNYLKEPLVALCTSPSPFIRRIFGSVISAIVGSYGILSWPDVFLKLLDVLKQPNTNQTAACAILGALEKISEDCANELVEVPDILEPFLQELLVLIDSVAITDSNSNGAAVDSLKTAFVKILIHFIPLQIPLLWANFNALMGRLFSKAVTEESFEYRLISCTILLEIMEAWSWEHLDSSQIGEIYQRVLEYSRNTSGIEDEEEERQLLRECGEFWLAEVQRENPSITNYPELLDQLVPLLIKRCVYHEEEDEDELCRALEDLSVPDDDKDLQPRHHKKLRSLTNRELESGQVSNEDDDEGSDSEDAQRRTVDESIASLRKCSAATLDALSLLLPAEELLNRLLPAIYGTVNSADWKLMEGSLLALGAVAEGVWKALDPHLPQIVPFLLRSVQEHPHPLVRSMALWTLSRFAAWIVRTELGHQNHFQNCWKTLINSMNDANKRVQLASCTALCRFLELQSVDPTIEGDINSKTPLISAELLQSLITTILIALQQYQRRSLLILYDLIRHLAPIIALSEHFFWDPQTWQYWRTIAQILVSRIGPHSLTDSSLFPLMEALMAMLSIDFEGTLLDLSVRDEMNSKALTIAENNLLALEEARKEGLPVAELIASEGLDDFLLASLDLLAAGIEQAGIPISPRFLPQLRKVLAAALLLQPSSNVRQSAFALCGDFASHQMASVFSGDLGFDTVYLAAVQDNMYPSSLHPKGSFQVSLAAATNAVWSLGEFAKMIPSSPNRSLRPHLISLFTFLQGQESLEMGARVYYENVAVSLGVLCLMETFSLQDPQLVVDSGFLTRWLRLLLTVDRDDERSSALAGLLRLLLRPAPPAHHLRMESDLKFLLESTGNLIDFSGPVGNDLLLQLKELGKIERISELLPTLTLHPKLCAILQNP